MRAADVMHAPTFAEVAALLVAADPDSLSGKARKARDYDIPIVGEAALARLTGAFPLRWPRAGAARCGLTKLD